VRVVCFATQQEFAQYRIRPEAAAFFVGASGGDYIVMPAGGRGDLRIPAHEYAHLLLHSTGWTLPEWIAEGISEVASSVKIGERDSHIGGDLPGRSQLLKSSRWMPPAELFSQRSVQDPLFYAQSWALADLLLFSPQYSAGFPGFLVALASGVSTEHALANVYHTTSDSVFADLRARLTRANFPVPLPGVAATASSIGVAPLDGFATRAMLGGLRLAAGDLTRAEALYRALGVERPRDPAIQAALGTIALQRGDSASAATFWKKAIDLGITDAAICFRYAALADTAGVAPAELRPVLERALALDPALDDARYKLALLEKNTGRAEAAVAQLRAMREVAPVRAFAYWSALADALLDLNRRSEAKQAIARAAAVASTVGERYRAVELEWMADTELAVELSGREARTIRVPINAPPRNPFIEAGDHARSAEATLQHVECTDAGLKVQLQTAQDPLTLSVPDPTRVQIRNAGSVNFELTCGPQQPRRVLVEYTAAGILRGLELR
jgi:tetratricopeptide (TPR) repeat protein